MTNIEKRLGRQLSEKEIGFVREIFDCLEGKCPDDVKEPCDGRCHECWLAEEKPKKTRLIKRMQEMEEAVSGLPEVLQRVINISDVWHVLENSIISEECPFPGTRYPECGGKKCSVCWNEEAES